MSETMSAAHANHEPAVEGRVASSQTLKAQDALRELILSGALKPGVRIPELNLVERLNVSRTPVRMALMKLAEDGLLDALPSGGYAAKDFSEDEMNDAIELRGTLEGLAARLAAERGVSPRLMAEARECLDEIDEVFAQPELTEEAFSQYVRGNSRFHELLLEMCGSDLVVRQIERVKALPFASPTGFLMARALGPSARDSLVVAQDQHRSLLEAIDNGESARAEALMREHARVARRNFQRALHTHSSLERVPGSNLIRRRASR